MALCAVFGAFSGDLFGGFVGGQCTTFGLQATSGRLDPVADRSS